MNAPETTSTRPYLLRALFEWCNDNGLTPHIAVRVGPNVQVPREFVRDGEIVLNIGYDATSGLQLGNDFIEFKARFGGKPREIMVPVDNVIAIYARETGQGMAFPSPEMSGDEMETLAADSDAAATDTQPDEAEQAADSDRVVQLVTQKAELGLIDGDLDDNGPRTPPPAGSRPALRRVK